MISEKQFIESSTHFWKSTLPLSGFFIHTNNKNIKQMKEYSSSINIAGRRWSFISEAAFHVLKHSIDHKLAIEYCMEQEDIYNLIEKKLRDKFSLYVDGDAVSYPLNGTEKKEVSSLASRILSFINLLNEEHNSIVISPPFKGCGYINTCFGDLLINDTLVEIKMLKRNFQLIDFKQLIVYCALNSVSKDYCIKNVTLFNPRQGKYVTYSVDELSINLSGKSADTLFSEIIEHISNGDVSR